MALQVTCEKCKAQLRIEEQLGDTIVSCPKCRAQVAVRGDRVPDQDVFLSYSAKDKKIADAVVSALEARKVSCWVAPRDVPPGATWAATIVRAIETSRIMVLILSRDSDRSRQVVREVDRAVAKGLVLIPFRVEDFALSAEMEYLLASTHWLDAANDTLGAAISDLVQVALAVKNSKLVSPARLVKRHRSSFRRAIVHLLWLVCGLAVGAICGWWLSVPTIHARTQAVATLVDQAELLTHEDTGVKNGQVSASDGTLVVKASFDQHLAVQKFLGAIAATKGVSLPPPEWAATSEAMKRSRETLLQPTQLNFIDQPLNDVIEYLQAMHEIPFSIDHPALLAKGITSDDTVTLNLTGVPLFVALAKVLRPLGAGYYVAETGIEVTTDVLEPQHGLVVIYDIHLLLKW